MPSTTSWTRFLKQINGFRATPSLGSQRNAGQPEGQAPQKKSERLKNQRSDAAGSAFTAAFAVL
jgi:hypothetical protein